MVKRRAGCHHATDVMAAIRGPWRSKLWPSLSQRATTHKSQVHNASTWSSMHGHRNQRSVMMWHGVGTDAVQPPAATLRFSSLAVRALTRVP